MKTFFTRPTTFILLYAIVCLLSSQPVMAQFTERLALAVKPGGPINRDVSGFSMSADGRYFAFTSEATNMVPGGTNGFRHVFFMDRRTLTGEHVSIGDRGQQGNNASYYPSISNDGRYIAFQSHATNLIDGQRTDYPGIFVRDRLAGTIRYLGGGRYPRISGNGRYIVFAITSGTGYDIQVYDQANGISASLGIPGVSGAAGFAISEDGRFVVVASNGILLRDRLLGTTERVDVSSTGQPANGGSRLPVISANGQVVAFISDATNLAPNDYNGKTDVFVRDRALGTTEQVDVNNAGEAANNGVYPGIGSPGYDGLSISGDGRYVAFYSSSTNLIPSDTNGQGDVFVRDRVARTTEIASITNSGLQGNGRSGYYGIRLSSEGRFVAFESSALLVPLHAGDVFIRDRQEATTEVASISLLPLVDNASYRPVLSENGRFAAFYSDATNLINQDTNGWEDVFLLDRQTATTERISVSSSGDESNNHSGVNGLSVSRDGRYVAFESSASNLVPGDTNGLSDIFLRDRAAQTTERLSVNHSGAQSNGSSRNPVLTPDGRYLVFSSYSTNLLTGDTNGKMDVFVRDRLLGTVERISVSNTNQQGNGTSGYSGISITPDGRYVAFDSSATNLMPGDTNGRLDVFVYDRTLRQIECVSINNAGTFGDADSGNFGVSISADGRYVAYDSKAANLVPNEFNGGRDIFVRDRIAGNTEYISFGEQAMHKDNVAPFLSRDGRYVVFRNHISDGAILLFDRVTQYLNSFGNGRNHFLSADGRYFAFERTATPLPSDVFVSGPLHMITPVSVAGTLTLEDIVPDASPQFLGFTFRPADNSGDVFKLVSVGPEGDFDLNGVPANTYTLHIQGKKYLGTNIMLDVSSGSVSGMTALLRAGDANLDNIVDVNDLSALIQAFDSDAAQPHWNSDADFNGDGVVEISDLSLLIRNFDLTGDP